MSVWQIYHVQLNEQIGNNCSAYSLMNIMYLQEVFHGKMPEYIFQFMPLKGFRSVNSQKVHDILKIILQQPNIIILDPHQIDAIKSKNLYVSFLSSNNELLDIQTSSGTQRINKVIASERLDGLDSLDRSLMKIYNSKDSGEHVWMYINMDNHFFSMLIDKTIKSIYIIDSRSLSDNYNISIIKLLNNISIIDKSRLFTPADVKHVTINMLYPLNQIFKQKNISGFMNQIQNIHDVKTKLSQLFDTRLEITSDYTLYDIPTRTKLYHLGVTVDDFDEIKETKQIVNTSNLTDDKKHPDPEYDKTKQDNDLLKINNQYPESLNDYILSKKSDDLIIDYIKVDIKEKNNLPNQVIHKPKQLKYDSGYYTKIRLPKRLDVPLFQLTDEMKSFFTSRGKSDIISTQKMYHQDMALMTHYLDQILGIEIPSYNNQTMNFNINHCSKYYYKKICPRNSIISQTSNQLAHEYMAYDIGTIIQEKLYKIHSTSNVPDLPDILYIISRHKMLIAKELHDTQEETGESSRIRSYQHFQHADIGDCQTHIMKDNSVITVCNYLVHEHKTELQKFILYTNSNFFFIIDTASNDVFVQDMDHFDYLLSFSEILFNIEVIMSMNEFKWVNNSLDAIKQIALSETPHLLKVDFMKNFESLCLMKSDVTLDTDPNKLSKLVSWSPIISCLTDLLATLQKIYSQNNKLTIHDMLLLFLGKSFDNSNPFLQLVSSIRYINGRNLQELSAVHKGMFYAEINEDKGIKKYLTRTHTLRPTTPKYIKQITMLAKKEFTINYLKKHKILPNILGPDDKKYQLQLYERTRDFVKLNNSKLEWWENIQFGKSLEIPETRDPIEYAKDKSSSLRGIKYTYGDSIPELLDIIQREEYKMSDFNLLEFLQLKPSEYYYRTSSEVIMYHDNPCRLVMKEREQKEEGRLYGCATTDNKHILSRYMIQVKQILGYYDGEFMTIPDRIRKDKLHEAAQLLASEDNYSIMMDMEGHNQSMQPNNTKELMEFFGNLFGESNWGLITHYFNQLHVFYYYHYIDKVMVSEGQLGGIEGWLNPLWTVHNLLVTKLFGINNNYPLHSIMVYSDDVDIIITLQDLDANEITDLYEKIKRHYLHYGLIVKPSQTVISKNRCTILRQHYYLGQKSDSSLKKLFSNTMFNEGNFISEQLEINGICSSTSSSLEYTNHIETSLFMKWYKCSYISLRGFAAYFGHTRENDMLDLDKLPKPLAHILEPYKPGIMNEVGKRIINNPKEIFKEKMINQTGFLDSLSYTNALLKLNYGYDLLKNITENEFDLILYYIKTDKYLQELFLFKLIMPESLGGNNCSLALTQFLSGHSNGFAKQIYYIKEMIQTQFFNKDLFYEKLANSLVQSRKISKNQLVDNPNEDEKKQADEKKEKSDEKDSHKCLLTEFPMINNSISVNTRINSTIKRLLITKCSNKVINSYIAQDSFREEYYENLLRMFSNKFVFRIANYYATYNIFFILDKLIRKIETSRSFLKKMKRPMFLNLQKRLFKAQLYNTIELFRDKNEHPTPITDDTDMIEYLINLRRTTYKKITFVDLSEPLYDHNTKLMTTADKIRYYGVNFQETEKYERAKLKHLFLIIPQDNLIHRSNTRQYAKPKFGNEILFKSDRDDDSVMFDSIKKQIVFKLVTATKWIIYDSYKYHRNLNKLNNNNIIYACNYALSTITSSNFQTLESFVRLPTGGEVLHRLKNLTFDTSSNIRVLPSQSVKYNVMMNDSTIVQFDLKDSNINYDYMRFRFILKHLMLDSYTTKILFLEYYKYIPSAYVKSVQIDLVDIASFDQPTWTHQQGIVTLQPIDLSKIRYLSEYTLIEENDTNAGTISSILMDKNENIDNLDRFQQNVINHYIQLHKEHLCSTLLKQPEHLWLQFIENVKLRYIEFYEKKDEEIMNEINQTVQDYINHRMDYYGKLNLNMEFKEISNKFKSYFNYSDTWWSKPLHELFNSYSFMRKQRNKNNLEDLLNIKSQYKNMVQSHKNELKKKTIMDIILNISLIYSIENKYTDNNKLKLIINSHDTLQCTKLALEEIDFLKNVSEFTIFVVELFEMNLDLINLGALITECINDICNVANLIDLDSLIVNDKDELNITKHEMQMDYTMPIELTYCAYDSMEFDLCFINNEPIINSLLNWAKECVECFADPIVFFSPTQSDAFVPQYALFQHLLEKEIISKDTFICDFTAGRGDGYYALSELGLLVESYGRKDLFSLLKKNPNIKFDENQDIDEPYTYTFIQFFDFIHVDISYLTTSADKIKDLLLNIKKFKKKFSLRINQLTPIFDDEFLLEIVKDYQLLVSFPVYKDLKHYYVYLVGYPSTDPYHKNSKNIKNSNLFKQITRSFLQLKNKNYLYTFQEVRLNDSISSYFYNNMNLGDLYQESTSFPANFMYSGLNRTLLRNMDYIQEVEFHSDFISKRMIFDLMKNSELSEGDTPSIYSEEDILSNYNRSTRLYKTYEQHLIKLMSERHKVRKIKLEDMTIEIINYLSIYHPLKMIRQSLSCLNILVKRQKIQLPIIRNDLVVAITTMVSLITNVSNDDDLAFKLSLDALAYSYIKEDFRHGITFLWLLSKQSKDLRSIAYKSLKMYRRLGYFYMSLDRNEFDNVRNLEIINKIENLGELAVDDIRNELNIKRTQKEQSRLRIKEKHHTNPIKQDWALPDTLDEPGNQFLSEQNLRSTIENFANAMTKSMNVLCYDDDISYDNIALDISGFSDSETARPIITDIFNNPIFSETLSGIFQNMERVFAENPDDADLFGEMSDIDFNE